MNKRLYSLGLACASLISIGLVSHSAEAQNIQLHYDLGRYVHPDAQAHRPVMTATLEQQSLDRWGDTFYFVDMTWLDQGAVSANWKFMRNLRFWSGPLSWHVRYDGGLRFIDTKSSSPATASRAISMRDAFMTGGTYTYLSKDRRLMLSFSALYKHIKGHHKPHNIEFCPVWKYSSASGLFSATGFLSLWSEEDNRPGWATDLKLMTQPQFWLNLNKVKGIAKDFNLSVGTEVRISKNIDAPQWICAPTLALKWSFR